jgi:Ca-activated chloride channel family protein
MVNESDKKVILKIIGAAAAVFIIVYLLVDPFPIDPDDGKKTIKDIETAHKLLDKIIKDINVNTVPHTPEPIEIQATDDREALRNSLPDISKYPPQVNSSTPNYIEIFSSTEKAGSGTDGWLTEVARDFNNAAIMIDGRRVSVRLRGIASGQGADYITSGKYLPDAYTPSNELWGEMVRSRGIKAQLVQKRLAGNVAGILLNKAKKDELVAKYGAINTTTIIDAVANNELEFGYTNPLTSSTGLNFLISALYTFDSSNLFSDKATAGFKSFQANIRVVAYTTLQMRDLAKSGVLDGCILEYQTYLNTPEIKSYEFTPFGARHDSPMYAIGELSAEKMKILNKFVEFTQQERYQDLATEYGFNGLNDYRSENAAVSGDVIIQAQKLWKKNKNAGKPICAIFVADVSGSMEGEPLNKLRQSLIQGQNYIGEDNLVGLVSYSDNVNIDLPIARFDLKQRSLFAGAVRDMQAGGNTAIIDAIAVAMNMLEEQKAAGPNADPNLRPRILVLSDGKRTSGHSLDEIRGIVQKYGIPIITIGYGHDADFAALQEISKMTEAPSINADTEDVVYQLRNLFDFVM